MSTMALKYNVSTNKKCRLCLRNTETYINLFDGNFQKMILELTSLEISEHDGYPKIACISCIDEIQQATKTRKRILECHKKLLKLNTNELEEENRNHPEIILVTDYSEESEDMPCEISHDGLEEILTYEDCSEVNGLDDFVIKTELSEDSNDMTFEVLDHLDTENEVNIVELDNKSEDELLRNQSCRKFKKTTLDSIKTILSSDIKKRKRTTRKVQRVDQYICEECGENFSCDKYAFNLHKMKHKKSQCKICGIVIRSDNMSKHLDNHTSGPRVCDLCGVTCKNIESLRGHIFYMHKKSKDEYKCDQCSRTYRQKYKLEQHKNKEHIGARRHICNVCQKKFFTFKDMNSHINMTHKKLRPHICKHCSKGFSSKYALKTHIRQHTNETPYKCSVCGEGFRQNVSLRTHLKSKHNIQEDKNFPCEFCDKSFASCFALKVHLRLHNDNSYQCRDCKEYFHQSIYLFNHMKTVHNIDENMIDLKEFKTIYDEQEMLSSEVGNTISEDLEVLSNEG
ncbi:zinc finger protein draculin-like [Harmonia axyridis]|uniref:zinc finger protein draculin-like n=1 Tax=Harmonia axyridis TaxID=115357 RepID=UPI001E276F83|nr:zinc finger protein draculin-like [Harmonia axyridis]